MVELLIAMTMALVVLAPTLAVLTSTVKDTAGASARATSIQSAEAGLREMDQDLSQAYEVEFPTSTAYTGCTATSGVQPCNQADVLARLAGTGFSGTDFEVRYDCSVASTTIIGDHACWRYLCSATYATGSASTCTAASGTLLSSRLVIDDLTNGTSTSPVFSFCYPNTTTSTAACAAGASRATSLTVTVDVPSTGNLSSNIGGDPSTTVLTDGVYMSNLDYNQ